MALVKVGLMILMSHDARAATKSLQAARYLLVMMIPVVEPFRATEICRKESCTAIGDAAHTAWAGI